MKFVFIILVSMISLPLLGQPIIGYLDFRIFSEKNATPITFEIGSKCRIESFLLDTNIIFSCIENAEYYEKDNVKNKVYSIDDGRIYNADPSRGFFVSLNKMFPNQRIVCSCGKKRMVIDFINMPVHGRIKIDSITFKKGYFQFDVANYLKERSMAYNCEFPESVYKRIFPKKGQCFLFFNKSYSVLVNLCQ